jgi:two-component system phosphate regulon sensor histidine kinase PhoR
MSFLSLLLLIVADLWFITLILVLAHRLSPHLGLAPLLVVIGGLAGALQFPSIPPLRVELFGQTALVFPASYLFLPPLLFGLLLIYIGEGTIQARSALLGILVVTLIAVIFQLIKSPSYSSTWLQVQPADPVAGAPLRVLLASLVTLVLDLLVLILVYQSLSNLRVRYPSRIAASLALLAALWCDALGFSLIAYAGTPVLGHRILINLLGKSVTWLLVTPLLVIYVAGLARFFPALPSSKQRPVFEIFTTTRQLEARASINYSLLQTLLQINQLIVRTTDPQVLLDQTCQLLVANRDYRLVWAGLTGKLSGVARAGKDDGYLKAYILDSDGSIRKDTPGGIAVQTRQAVVIPNIAEHVTQSPWQRAAVERGYGSVVAFPLNHTRQLFGVLTVYAARANSFDQAEVQLLQELADDLANALTNLEVRQKQTSLFAASENLPDALVICDLDGVITYANPATALLVNLPMEDLIGRNVATFIGTDSNAIYQAHEATLLAQGDVIAEFEITVQGRGVVYLAVRASLVRDQMGLPFQAVIGASDTTHRHLYERQLLTLNRLVTELVEIHDKDELLQQILVASKDILTGWATAIFLVSPENPRQITDFFRLNLPEAYAQQIAQGYSGLPGDTVARTRKPAYVEDTLNDPVYLERVKFMADYGIRSLLVLPVLYQDQSFGALVVYFDQPHIFQEEELQLGMTLAHTLAIALQNVHLYHSEQSQRQLAEALAQAATSVNRFLKLDVVIDQILEQTIRLAKCNSTNIMLVEGNSARMVRRMSYDETPFKPEEDPKFKLPLTNPILQRMLDSHQPVLIGDTSKDSDWVLTEGSEWIRSYAGAPLQVGGYVVGFLNVDSTQPNFFSAETTRRLQMLADHAAIAIHNAELYEDSRRQAQELTTLIQAAAAFISSLDIDRVLRNLAVQMANLVHADGCAISDYEPDKQTVTLLAIHEEKSVRFVPGFKEPYQLNEYPVTRQVLERCIPIQFHADDPETDPSEKDLMHRANVSTLLMLPIVLREKTMGLVEMESCDPKRVFTHREISLLQTLASNAAHAIHNARLYTQLQTYANELEDRVRQRTAELQAAKERIEAILASVPDAVFVLDEQNQSVMANAAGEALMVVAKQHSLDLFSPQFMEPLKLGILASEQAVRQVQGRAYQALASPMPLDAHTTGLVVVFRDVTRFHELDQMKTRFVSDVSHELRTPLTNIMLYLDLLSALDDPRKAPGYLATLQRETRRLGYLIEDLLTISRLEAGRIDISIKPLDINQLLVELVSDRSKLASVRELSLAFKPAEQLPLGEADAGLLNQAVSNLLTNAILYTPAGGSIELSTSLRQDEGLDWVAIQVADTGVGIPPGELEVIFDRFYRGLASRQTGAPGTGLGLAIAREITNRVGGKITVESQVGAGSKFVIWLKAVL